MVEQREVAHAGRAAAVRRRAPVRERQRGATCVTGDVNRDYLDHLQNQRSDNAKQERRDAESEEVIEMYNNA